MQPHKTCVSNNNKWFKTKTSRKNVRMKKVNKQVYIRAHHTPHSQRGSSISHIVLKLTLINYRYITQNEIKFDILPFVSNSKPSENNFGSPLVNVLFAQCVQIKPSHKVWAWCSMSSYLSYRNFLRKNILTLKDQTVQTSASPPTMLAICTMDVKYLPAVSCMLPFTRNELWHAKWSLNA